MKGSMAWRRWIAALAVLGASVSVGHADPVTERDPRADGLRRISAYEAGKPIIRVDRRPDGTVHRCVNAARLVTPPGGGPSRTEFGIERTRTEGVPGPDITMFFRIRFLDGPNGKPLRVRDPVMEINWLRPTADWRLETASTGWYRRSKLAPQSDDEERIRFVSEIQNGLNDIVSTFPDGTHRWHSVRSSGSPWHFNMFVDCACRLAADMPEETRDWLLCPKPRRD